MSLVYIPSHVKAFPDFSVAFHTSNLQHFSKPCTAEYSGQLPPDGGTFYTVDTMNAARTHYRKMWPPILYAASLWLKETGFTSVDKDKSKPANMQADESDTDRFHLLVGESGPHQKLVVSSDNLLV